MMLDHAAAAIEFTPEAFLTTVSPPLFFALITSVVVHIGSSPLMSDHLIKESGSKGNPHQKRTVLIQNQHKAHAGE